MNHEIHNIIIIGAGAAGLFCANQIQNNDSILILEGADFPAQKLLLSAKGRGNLTNKNINLQTDYSTDDKSFVETAFQNYGVSDFLDFLKNEGIEIKEEDFGRVLLASNKVAQLKEKLLENIGNKGVKISYNCKIEKIEKNNDIFEITTNDQKYYTKNLIVATGGASFPKLGATSIAIQIAEQFGLEITPFYPALAGFETDQNFSSLSGSSIIGEVNLIKDEEILYKQTGPILFTHRGLSGPCIFNASLFMREKGSYKIRINIEKFEITKRLLTFLGFRENKLKSYQIPANIKNVRGLDEAKVCGGGIKTKNLNSNFECKNIPGLYFIGECIDVTGKTGGFNLQRCRTSGAICAKNFCE